jgi:outer membrane protein TolC
VLGASWSLPLFDRNQGARAEATRRRAAAEARLALATAAYAVRVGGAEAAYGRLEQAAHDAQTSIQGVPALVEAATASFAAGESTATDLLDVLRSALDAQTRAIDAHAAALAAARTLEAARMGLELGDLR